jgi:UDP-glucose 4-epimerase
MSTLVTGSEGFVGKRLVSTLRENGANVVEIDAKKGVDLTQWKQLNDCMKNVPPPDVIFHLAAIVFIPYSFQHPRITYNTNLMGTLNMLEIARMMDVKKFVFASSYVYGTPKYLPIDENHPLQAISPYNRSKILGEELCRGYYEDYSVACIILRPFNIYGNGQNKQFLIPQIIDQLPSKKIVLQNPTPKRDYVHIDDVISAYIKAATHDFVGFEIFNIGTGSSYSVKEIVDKVIEVSQKKGVTVMYTYKKRENEIMNIVANIQKAKEKMGWQPSIDINKGLSLLMKEAKL